MQVIVYLFLFYYLCVMTAKEFLRTEATLNLTEVAKLMWPTNVNATAYLSRKLAGNDPKRQWTAKDEERAKSVLKQLGVRIEALE